MSGSTVANTGQALVSFDSRVSLDAMQGLVKSRSDLFMTAYHRRQEMLESAKVNTVWDLKPIDFSVKMYQPNPPPRNTKESMVKNWSVLKLKNNLSSKEIRKESRLVESSVPLLKLPSLLVPKDIDELPEFVAKFRPPSSQTSRRSFIREGMYAKDPYKTDSVGIHRRDIFRKLEDFKKFSKYGIQDFDTSCAADPHGLRFKHNMLSKTLPELSTTEQISIRTCQSEPMPRLHQPPKWEKRNHLPRSAYKRGKSPGTVLMDSVQRKAVWVDGKEKTGGIMRPDIYDYKIKDWCEVTQAPSEIDGPFPLA
ncbi:uncharacterized protein LOC135682690 [Rhopilema esculentum]|uniref:uncharacterized protein LOC135682690 n=1 Tax=Rhopilema esculentum TaxID=499914 RepID=UPI0031E0546F|eukprot:gene13938-4893_t